MERNLFIYNMLRMQPGIESLGTTFASSLCGMFVAVRFGHDFRP